MVVAGMSVIQSEQGFAEMLHLGIGREIASSSHNAQHRGISSQEHDYLAMSFT